MSPLKSPKPQRQGRNKKPGLLFSIQTYWNSWFGIRDVRMTENYCSSACVRCPYLLQRGVLVEATVFEIHLIITGRLDVVGVHLQKTPTNVSTTNLRHGQSRQVWSCCWGRVLTRSTVFLLFVSASCPEIKASHFSLSAAGSSGGHKTFF